MSCVKGKVHDKFLQIFQFRLSQYILVLSLAWILETGQDLQKFFDLQLL